MNSCSNPYAADPSNSAGPLRRRPGRRAVRDRILLYLGSAGVDDVAGLELAAECLRRVGGDARHEKAMDALDGLLGEKGVVPPSFMLDARLGSFPPLERRSMVSRKMESPSFFPAARKIILDMLGI